MMQLEIAGAVLAGLLIFLIIILFLGLFVYPLICEIRDGFKNWKWQGKCDRVKAVNDEIVVVRKRITILKRQKASKEIIDRWENRLIELHQDLINLSEWFTGPESERGRDWFANDGIDASTNAHRGIVPA